VTEKLNLGGDNIGEAIGLNAFGYPWRESNIMKLYEAFAKQKLAFDLGRLKCDETRSSSSKKSTLLTRMRPLFAFF
jgi:hypothetical protein